MTNPKPRRVLKVPWAEPFIGDEEIHEVTDSLQAGWVSMGPKVRALEEGIAAYAGVKHAVAVSNGTAALDAALKVLGVGPGDEVIVPALTYIATVNAVMYQGARPVLADVDPDTFNLDPVNVKDRLSDQTRVLMPIDYGGMASDGAAFEALCRDSAIQFVKDGAHSLGGASNGRSLLAYGALSTLSLHSAKVMTTVEGGMVLTDDGDLDRKIRMFRNQGEDPNRKYFHPVIGQNYRMTDLHAAIGLAQFRRLDAFLAKRRAIAARYTEAFRHHEGIRLQRIPDDATPAWFFYPILVHGRDHVISELKARGVETRVGWPYPIHEQPPYRDLGAPGDFPHAESIARHVLNLPLFYSMTDEQIDHVIDCVLSAAEQEVRLGGTPRSAKGV